jgi:hypothetical protein
MPRPKADPIQTKLKRQQRNQRYLANSTVKERVRDRDRLYQQRKREQARLRLHSDPLAQLADVATQRRYLREAPGAPGDAEREVRMEEEEEVRGPIVDAGIAVEEDGAILEGFADPLNGGWDDGGFDDGGGFPDEPESDVDGGGDGGGLNRRFPDEPESDMNNDSDDEFSDEPGVHDEGNDSMKRRHIDMIETRVKEEEHEGPAGPTGRIFIDLTFIFST